MKKVITVFGSSIPKEGDVEYEIAYRLGQLIAENDFDVCSGGYYGIMEAVSKGAVDFGNNAIGVTLAYLKLPPNKFITQNIICQTLFERIEKLISTASCFVVLNGGTGTLLEFSAVREFINKNLITSKPIFVVGTMWGKMIDTVNKRMEFEGRKTDLVKHFTNVKEFIDHVDKNGFKLK